MSLEGDGNICCESGSCMPFALSNSQQVRAVLKVVTKFPAGHILHTHNRPHSLHPQQVTLPTLTVDAGRACRGR